MKEVLFISSMIIFGIMGILILSILFYFLGTIAFSSKYSNAERMVGSIGLLFFIGGILFLISLIL